MNAPADINRLIVSFRYLGSLVYFREAVQFWRRTDHGLLQMQQIADAAEKMHAAGGMPAEAENAMLLHLQALDAGQSAYGMQGMFVSDPLGHLLALFATLAVMITVARPSAPRMSCPNRRSASLNER